MTMMQSEDAPVDFDQALAERLADNPELLDVADDNASEVLLRLGWNMALEQLARWAATERAGQTVHSAWVHGMTKQYRDVDRHRLKWDTMDQADRDLDAVIARDLINASLRALGSGAT